MLEFQLESAAVHQVDGVGEILGLRGAGVNQGEFFEVEVIEWQCAFPGAYYSERQDAAAHAQLAQPIDGLAALLCEKLLRPGGWLLLDDIYWTYAGHETAPGQGPDDLHLSAAERSVPHVEAVFNLVVKQHPAFTRFLVEDDEWGWAQKAPDQPRRYELATTTSLKALLIRSLRRTKRAVAS